ncbi:hypothetical protein BPAE_0010g00700 [Botrytis paeoniae]|uniref:Heterokaryon incompatibility domain-containing protein n=1 Tax=Botrytis paeoniae TaxID=278948 RepID=A0A4Z1FZC3_9HELO|nr:hypothetical protein BPAE_0010g00700 [Botrytis paeoniae]
MTDRRNPLRNSAATLDLQDGSSKSTVYILPNGQPRNTPLPPPTDSRDWCYQEDLLFSRLCRDENQIQRRPGHRYKDYVAPLWSWASIDAPVLFYVANARHWRKPQLGTTLRDPELIHAEAHPVSYFKTGAVKSGSVEISAYLVMTRTAPVEPFLFNTRQGSHTYGRRNCVDPLTGAALGLIVFDVALEAKDDMLLCCALLQTENMNLWEKNGTAGLSLALRVKGATAKHWKCTRVGYVQFTSVFGKYAQKCRVELS